MNEHTQSDAPTWITVDQAFQICLDHGLTRTKKTIRQWCRQHHVEGQKQTTPTGERWVLDSSSLSVKIKAEKEMQEQFAQVQTGAHPSEPLQGNDMRQSQPDPVQTRADRFEQVRTGADGSERVSGEAVQELENKLRSLEIDKAVRDKQIEFLTKQNEDGHENLMSQSRYIGHLETQVMQLGGRPDQTFLAAPTPNPNPAQEFQSRDKMQV